ncbi:MAG: hypothetical protein JHD04_13125 [Nocardioides sp.]|nr:hypothetical protein [Nocardioides sp.]
MSGPGGAAARGTGAETVLVPPSRLERWVVNFRARHGATALAVAGGALSGAAEDSSTFTARLPFDAAYAGLPDPVAFAAGATTPDDWGLLLVRKGGFAVARLSGGATVASKVGQRHVQGRTKAGGQSQQRFARRRDNQARQAYEAAADHAARLLGDLRGPLVGGGDRTAVEEVLADPRLRRLVPVEPWLPVPDPRRAVLEQAARDAAAVRVTVVNAGAEPGEAT